MQSTTVDIPTAGVANVLVPSAFITQHGPVTVERIRGNIHIFNDDSDSATAAVNVGYKFLKVQVNDASGITDDVDVFDTDIEDIGRRILDQRIIRLGAAAASDFQATEVQIEIDIKVRIRISIKEELICLLDASVINRARHLTMLRALCRVS